LKNKAEEMRAAVFAVTNRLSDGTSLAEYPAFKLLGIESTTQLKGSLDGIAENAAWLQNLCDVIFKQISPAYTSRKANFVPSNLEDILDRNGKLIARDYEPIYGGEDGSTVTGASNLKLYNGDFLEIKKELEDAGLKPRIDVVSRIADPEGEDEMDWLTINILEG
jgi:hypothetical protein